METICQACGYQRKPTDQAPDWECPACGKAYSKTSHGSPMLMPAKVQPPSDSGKPHAEDSACANYLAEHYGIPQTYRNNFLQRVVTPALAMIGILAVNGLFLAILLGSNKHGLSLDWMIFIAVGFMLLATYFVASVIRRSMTIRADSIKIVLPLSTSTRVIRAMDVIGYTTDYVRAYRASGWRYSFVCRQHGRQEERVYFSLGPDNLKDPRLRGLFRAMHNYGESSLDKLLGEVMSGELRMLDQVSAGMLFLIDIFIACCIYFVAVKM